MAETDQPTIITVEGVHKSFKLPHEKHASLKSAAVNFYKRGKSFERQSVLSDINFEIKKGEFFGIVGRNGSGKSTLLKLLAGIYVPDKGTIDVGGKLTPFIELGVGFNPELTGRENVFLNGALLGFSHKEMLGMYDAIVDFAELSRFMDQKLKNYSSGMQIRLAFSIAIRANTEILLIDEVLAVGDAKFQEKCFEFFDEIKGQRTVIFVSHDMKAVAKYCDQVLVLEKSKMIDVGPAEDMTLRYSAIMANEELKIRKSEKTGGVHIGSGEAKVTKISLHDAKGKDIEAAQPGEPFSIRVHYATTKTIPKAGFLVSIFAQNGGKLFSANTGVDQVKVKDLKGKGYVDLLIKENPLAPGGYKVNVGIFDERIFYAYDHFRDAFEFSVRGERLNNDSNLSLQTTWTVVKDS